MLLFPFLFCLPRSGWTPCCIDEKNPLWYSFFVISPDLILPFGRRGTIDRDVQCEIFRCFIIICHPIRPGCTCGRLRKVGTRTLPSIPLDPVNVKASGRRRLVQRCHSGALECQHEMGTRRISQVDSSIRYSRPGR